MQQDKSTAERPTAAQIPQPPAFISHLWRVCLFYVVVYLLPGLFVCWLLVGLAVGLLGFGELRLGVLVRLLFLVWLVSWLVCLIGVFYMFDWLERRKA